MMIPSALTKAVSFTICCFFGMKDLFNLFCLFFKSTTMYGTFGRCNLLEFPFKDSVRILQLITTGRRAVLMSECRGVSRPVASRDTRCYLDGLVLKDTTGRRTPLTSFSSRCLLMHELAPVSFNPSNMQTQ